jgi:S1-C subfamily serine protease
MTHASQFPRRGLILAVVGLALAAVPCVADSLRSADPKPGALVDKVAADGPAAKAGIAVNDVVTAMDGTPVQSMLQVGALLARCKPGDTLAVTLTRASDGVSVEVDVTVGASPRDASRPYLGLTFFGWVQFMPGEKAHSAPTEEPFNI